MHNMDTSSSFSKKVIPCANKMCFIRLDKANIYCIKEYSIYN